MAKIQSNQSSLFLDHNNNFFSVSRGKSGSNSSKVPKIDYSNYLFNNLEQKVKRHSQADLKTESSNQET
jgi:hypothetical protein